MNLVFERNRIKEESWYIGPNKNQQREYAKAKTKGNYKGFVRLIDYWVRKCKNDRSGCQINWA